MAGSVLDSEEDTASALEDSATPVELVGCSGSGSAGLSIPGMSVKRRW